jgi:hypothetical protein
MRSEFSLTDGLDRRIFRWKWNAAAVHLACQCIDVVVAPASDTCPIVPRGLRRGILELGIAIVTLGSGIAHRGAGVPGAAVIARLSVNCGRSGCCAVLDWP